MKAIKAIGQFMLTPVIAILMPLLVTVYLGAVIYHAIRFDETKAEPTLVR